MTELLDQEDRAGQAEYEQAMAEQEQEENEERENELADCIQARGFHSAMEAVLYEMADYDSISKFAEAAGYKDLGAFIHSFYDASDDPDSEFWKQIVIDVIA